MQSFFGNLIGPLYATIFASPWFYPMHKAIFHLGLRGMGCFNCTARTSGEDHFVRRTLPTLLSTNHPVLFDVGANVGNYTHLLHSQLPGAKLFSFEPHPRNFSSLESRVGGYANCINIALGCDCREVDLFDRADQDGSSHASLHRDVISDFHHQSVVAHSTEMKTVDVVAREHDVARIDLLKIDTEGHEYDVLRGASGMIAERRISAIQFEFGSLQCYSRAFLRDFKKLLPGYTFFRLLPRSLLKINWTPVETEIFGYQNIVAISEEVLGTSN